MTVPTEKQRMSSRHTRKLDKKKKSTRELVHFQNEFRACTSFERIMRWYRLLSNRRFHKAIRRIPTNNTFHYEITDFYI